MIKHVPGLWYPEGAGEDDSHCGRGQGVGETSPSCVSPSPLVVSGPFADIVCTSTRLPETPELCRSWVLLQLKCGVDKHPGGSPHDYHRDTGVY